MSVKQGIGFRPGKGRMPVGSGDINARYVTPVLFTLAILLSAGLLFFIQPLLTRMVTPLVGGAPGVWTTATLFFQAMMIAGYLYAHLITRLPRIRHQVGLHLLVWLFASSTLPLTIPSQWEPDLSVPIQTQTLALYAMTIGMPFFFLSANAPLIQTWYGRTRGPSSHDPYFLYGASNVGSLVALLGFPLVAEPFLGVSAISMGWSAGFIGLGALIFISVLWTTRDHPDAKTVLPITDQKSDLRTLFTWGAVAFVPSSMMLALTTRITTDFGSFPLLWVVPLAVYLLTYVGGFQTRPLLADKIMVWLYPTALAAMAVLGMTRLTGLISTWSAGLMILAFALIGLHLHRVLYQMRPDPSRLTVFYLTLAIGGAAGGFFNAIIAPAMMDGMHEFPLTLLAGVAILLLTSGPSEARSAMNSRLGTVLCLILLAGISFEPEVFSGLGASSLTVAAILIGCLLLIFPPLMRTGVAIMTAVTAAVILSSGSGLAIYTERNFFGLHTVIDNGDFRGYLNGTTIHGAVELRQGRPPEPLYYYRQNGPLADLARSEAWQEADRIGLVGLGVGSMLFYRNPEQDVALYEIDPAVVDIALDPDLFGFVSTYGEGAELHVGDARIILERQKMNGFGALLIDAYSSDAVPMHLATVEAMEIFLEDLTPDGVLAFHISNRYFDLRIPIGAAAAHLGMKVYHREDLPSDASRIGYNSKISALVVVRPGERHDFLTDPGSSWREIRVDPSLAWSDDKASPITALR